MHSVSGQIALGAYVIVVGPLIEELAFRGWIQRAIERGFGRVAGVAGAAALFVVPHLWYGHVALLLIPFVLALLWGASVIKLRTLYAAVLLHATWNAVMFAAVLSQAGSGTNWLLALVGTSSRATLVALLLAGSIAWLAMGLFATERSGGRRGRVQHDYGATD